MTSQKLSDAFPSPDTQIERAIPTYVRKLKDFLDLMNLREVRMFLKDAGIETDNLETIVRQEINDDNYKPHFLSGDAPYDPAASFGSLKKMVEGRQIGRLLREVSGISKDDWYARIDAKIAAIGNEKIVRASNGYYYNPTKANLE